MFFRRMVAWTVVPTVIYVESVEDARNTELCCLLYSLSINLGLAEITSVHRVGRVAWVI